ncbi:MAG: hypothetical protein MI785_05310, partial [Kiloniellales bacterium]|nr:hypothetical protein [Kiloniellales bacterium]
KPTPSPETTDVIEREGADGWIVSARDFFQEFGPSIVNTYGPIVAEVARGAIPGSGLYDGYNSFREGNTAEGLFNVVSEVPALKAIKLGVIVLDTVRKSQKRSNIVFRAVRDSNELEDIMSGRGILRGKGRTTATQHVRGVNHPNNPWVSTTKSLKEARRYAVGRGNSPPNAIVAIDLDKLSNDTLDVSSPFLSAKHLKNNIAQRFAAKSREVLINGSIPSRAIEILED